MKTFAVDCIFAYASRGHRYSLSLHRRCCGSGGERILKKFLKKIQKKFARMKKML